MPEEFGVLHIQLQHFSDASEDGYGAASYLRLEDAREGSIVDWLWANLVLLP